MAVPLSRDEERAETNWGADRKEGLLAAYQHSTSRTSNWPVCNLSLQKSPRRGQSAPPSTSLSLLPLTAACFPCSSPPQIWDFRSRDVTCLQLNFVPIFEDCQHSSRRDWGISPSPAIPGEDLLAYISPLTAHTK
ncbi:unnamed protein product [Natator depressus]